MAEKVQRWVNIERLDFSGGSVPGKTKVHAQIMAVNEHGAFQIAADFELEIEPQYQWKSIQAEAVRRLRGVLDPDLIQ
jgi:hypothetical protein